MLQLRRGLIETQAVVPLVLQDVGNVIIVVLQVEVQVQMEVLLILLMQQADLLIVVVLIGICILKRRHQTTQVQRLVFTLLVILYLQVKQSL